MSISCQRLEVFSHHQNLIFMLILDWKEIGHGWNFVGRVFVNVVVIVVDVVVVDVVVVVVNVVVDAVNVVDVVVVADVKSVLN